MQTIHTPFNFLFFKFISRRCYVFHCDVYDSRPNFSLFCGFIYSLSFHQTTFTATWSKRSAAGRKPLRYARWERMAYLCTLGWHMGFVEFFNPPYRYVSWISSRRHMFCHCTRSTHYYRQFCWGCKQYAGQEKCDLFRSTRSSNGRRACWLETYAGSFALRRPFPPFPASISQSHRKSGSREAFFSEWRARSSAFSTTSVYETRRLGCPYTKVSYPP